MTMSIGGVTIPDDEKPDVATLSFSGEVIWAESNPLGYKGRIMRRVAEDAKEHVLHHWLTDATRASLQAVADADADAVFIWNDGPLNINVNVTVKRFHAVQDALGVAIARWSTDIVLVETSPA